MLSRRQYFWLAGHVMLAICIVPAVRWVLLHREYFYEQRSGQELVRQLRDRRPADVSADRWEWAWSWAVTAYCNVCFSPEHVPLEELKRFRSELEERLRGPVDLSTVDWIWERLGRTGSHGKSYRQQFEPYYREGLGVARERR